MTEKKLSQCPACGKRRLVRLIGAGTGIIFKGNGFYETDYKRKEPQKEAPAAPSSCPASCSCPAKEAAQAQKPKKA